MTPWDALQAELDLWGAAGQTATLWWRDDDATAATPALERLLERATRFHIPLCLAVIPATAEASLRARIAEAPQASVVQHGYAHQNWASAGAKKMEFAEHRPVAAMVADLALGLTSLTDSYGDQLRPILVPPWNRIAAALLPHLTNIGFRGISAFGSRWLSNLPPGLRQVNTHVDPIDWRGTRGFVGEAAALGALLEHLQARRKGAAPPDEPTGLLTHHAVEDNAGRHFAEKLFATALMHPAIRWVSADHLFPHP